MTGGHFPEVRPNIRDPLAERLVGQGKAFEIEEVMVRGVRQQVFKHAPRNLAAIFEQAQALGERTMVVHGDERHSYAEIFSRAAALSRNLRERYNVGPGSRVALAMANRAEWIFGLIAVTATGGVAALVNSRGTAEEMLHAMATADCSLAILDAERAEALGGKGPPGIVVDDPLFAGLTRPEPGETLAPLAMDPDDGALILFTSGTTGHPKGALLSHGALAHATSMSAMMGALQDLLYEEETGIAVPPDQASMAGPAMVLTPMFHLTGMLPVVRGMALGAAIHIMAKWNLDIAFDMIETSGLSRIAFVPTTLFDMLASPRATPENLAAIRNLAYGGGPLNVELVAEVRRRMPGSLITNTYGQSENTGWACSLSGEAYVANPLSCGWAVPTVEVCVRCDDGSEADIGEPGELWVKSAAVMNGYVGDPEATAAALIDGWHATGDIGMVDEAGMFTILDRKSAMIISGGENVYCAEVERVLFDHPDVREAIAYGVPDERLGERVEAAAVLMPDADSGADALAEYCRLRLAGYKVPKRIVVTRELLPRTATGKIDRGTFLDSLQAGE